MERVPAEPAGAGQWAAARGFGELALGRTGKFELFALVRRAPGPDPLLTIYIEGDGAPWRSSFHPPPDPTPWRPVALGLASVQPQGDAVYLARPCQYLRGNEDCSVEYWSSRRFSEEVLAAYDIAFDRLRAVFPASQLRLVGYSGGGVIALALLARRQDIAQVVTVATPVDLESWLAEHGLDGFAGGLPRLPPRGDAKWHGVIHLAGSDDDVVPPTVLRRAAARMGGRLVEVEGFGHECCWVGEWPRRWRDLIEIQGGK